jgi:NADH-quinone oxidoreductase subunit M
VPGVVLAAAYLLWLYQRVFFGTVTNPKNEKLQDLTPREVLTFVPLLIMAFWIGLYPKPFFQILEQPVSQIMQEVHSPQARGPMNAAVQPENQSGAPAEVALRASTDQRSPVAPARKGKN